HPPDIHSFPTRRSSDLDLEPSQASLRFRGFSEIKSRAPDHPQTPAYDRVSSRPPWRTTPQGWCTRYGDVLELVKSRDDRLVLVKDRKSTRLNSSHLGIS